jgi:ribosomal protein S12 methylthiotransferase accessory factor
MKKGQRPCWRCLTEALRKNRPIENYLSENGGKPVLPVSPTSTVSMQFGISAAIIQLTKKLLHAADGDAELITLDMWNFSVGTHLIRTRPQCTACGDPLSYSRLPSNPVALNDVPRKFVENGGYRIVAPEKTWEKYKHLVSPLTGIVSHIDTYGKKNHQLRPVWKATFFVNPCRAHVDKNERFVKNSFGKGATAEQSRASALCEAIERYSFLYCGEEPRIRGTYNGLKPRGGIDPRALQHFSEKQYALRHEAAAPRSPQKIPRPFNPDLEISWTPVWSLTSHVWRYAPLQFCFSLTPTPDEENVCPFVSNGSAAGNCFEEALLQGILELVERDATAIWWYNRVVRPGIDVESFHDGYLNGVKTHYKEMGWDVWVLDVTHDLRLPAAVALAKNHATKHFAVGLGCHLSMHLAIQRAITEMHQTFDPADSHNPVWTEEEIENPAFLYPGDRPATKSGDWPLIPERSLKDDISDCAERIRKAGMELFVLNATRPDIGVCAVKAIVPGLRHFWKQLGPGRLSTVPVTLGWLDQELTEDEMNPKELAL